MIYPTSRASSSRAVLQLAHPKRQQTLTLRLLSSTTPTRDDGLTGTYGNQSKVPRLPIPNLEKTIEAYVKSLVPLLEQKVSEWL